MSRPERPKQFLTLMGDKTMFQATLERTHNSSMFGPPIIVAGMAHRELVEQQLSEIGISDAQIILEPSARNTAPAIALAALAAEDPSTALLIMPSDHVITNLAAFHQAVRAALAVAQEGWLTTFGITPTGPETGYGYIQMAQAIATNVYQAAKFIEKPDAQRAAAMIANGDHVWNGGIFLFRADHYLDALARYAPEMLTAAQLAMRNAVIEGNAVLPDAGSFAASPSNSIDYTVMEKATRVAVVPVTMGWSDVGSWDALYELNATDIAVDTLEIESSGNLVRSDGIRIHLAGVENMIVVASGNDVLIVPRGKSQDVKRIVEALQAKRD